MNIIRVLGTVALSVVIYHLFMSVLPLGFGLVPGLSVAILDFTGESTPFYGDLVLVILGVLWGTIAMFSSAFLLKDFKKEALAVVAVCIWAYTALFSSVFSGITLAMTFTGLAIFAISQYVVLPNMDKFQNLVYSLFSSLSAAVKSKISKHESI